IVFADSGPVEGNDQAPTLLCYGHYDVQPIGDPDLWDTPAFEPTIREGTIYARGSADNKGQLMTHLAAMRSWHQTVGKFPIRIKFLAEGEEEIGSPSLSKFLKDNKDLLACDYVVMSDTEKFDDHTPAIFISTRGIILKEIIVKGPTRDLHSGTYGGTLANPANVLAQIIASLHDERKRVTIPGFYDDLIQLNQQERKNLAEYGLKDADLVKNTGSPAPSGEDAYTTAERQTIRPTLDVNGIVGGYTGQGAATIIPSKASAKISMRLVPNQDPDKISKDFDRAVQQACPQDVTMDIVQHGSCAAYQAPSDSPGIKAAATALETCYGKPPVFTRGGGSLPILPMFKRVLGADSLLFGFAMPDCNLHSPNEFYRLSDWKTGTQCIVRFINHMGSLDT
ncbi:MAG: M20/M25/M40 family metallo-hydrolase, partial [Planctomycetota bacterium]